MIEAGYSPQTAVTPHELTKSKAWQEMLNESIPLQKIFKAHQESLEATKIFGSPTEPDRVVEDYPTRLRAAELGYKLHGKLTEKVEHSGEIVVIPILGGLAKGKVVDVSDNNSN